MNLFSHRAFRRPLVKSKALQTRSIYKNGPTERSLFKYARLSALLLAAVVLAAAFYSVSSAATLRGSADGRGSKVLSASGPVLPTRIASDESVGRAASSLPGTLEEQLFKQWRSAGLLPLMMPQASPPGVATFAADCTTPKSVFGPNETICAHVSGTIAGYRLIWSNAENAVAQNTAITAANNSFTLTSSPSLGDWRVIVYEPFGGRVYSLASFTVDDTANPTTDLVVSSSAIDNSVAAGSQVLFGVELSNLGPSTATTVHLTDAVPANATFVSFTQISGPVFTCTTPNAGDTGTVDCSIASLDRGDMASFVAVYQVNGGVSVGDEVANAAGISNAVTDQNDDNDASTALASVVSAPCTLGCPENVIVDVDSGQAGAIVTYNDPSATASCGTAGTGNAGEPIPVVSCSVPSGSFFPIGTTTVTCVGRTDGACSFQVTVNNPGGGLTISLNGGNTITHECGTTFTDPGATAINGAGQSVPVTSSALTCDQDGDCTSLINRGTPSGTYTITYTATDGEFSVSAQRTVNVVDTEAPLITIDGANPYRIIQGSCSPFVDPGVSANDSCGGSVGVTRSVSGPGGATSVDPAVAGTYTVTYTATDGTHQATATRTVIVGQFNEDEADQPASANVPPSITLNGDDQMTIECGSTFNDPGASASVCGSSIPVTTSGTLDTHTPGVYSITYTATSGSLSSETHRTVTVQDTAAPTIEILGSSTMTVECHSSFTDPGATAHDACEGDSPASASGTVDPNTVGTYTIVYNATDSNGHVATPVSRTVNVVDTTAPVVTAPPDVTVYTGAGATTCTVVVSDATLGTGSANDACEGPVSVTRSGVPAGNVFPVGVTNVTYSATDAHNNTGTAIQKVTVIDNTAPIITTNGQTRSMWPANHKYQTFQVTDFVTSVSDNCTALGVGNVVISQVTSDETENGSGDGNTLNDIVIASDCKSVQLRAERNGGGNGRVYKITFRVKDAAGNTTTATGKVVVPHNVGQTPVDNGPNYTVNGNCP